MMGSDAVLKESVIKKSPPLYGFLGKGAGGNRSMAVKERFPPEKRFPLELGGAGGAGEGQHVADVAYPGQVHNQAFKAQAKAGVEAVETQP